MGFVVKNTTSFGLLDLLCPHTCRGCGRLGTVICECCKKNLLAGRQNICPICKQMVAQSAKDFKNNRGCKSCEMPFWGLWCFDWREGVLEKLVEEYKYSSVRAMAETLVGLYDEILPVGLEDVVVVPLPTIGKHVRERGFDHTLTLAKKLAKLRGWDCQQVLVRVADTVQVGSKISDRKTQAGKAYAVKGKVDPSRHYLLLDDVWTTGATMLAAEKVLRAAGAEQISAAVLAVSKMKAE